MLRYSFNPVARCDMCGATDFRLLGMRLNRSQGRSPRKVGGIAVSVKQCRTCDLIFADPQPVPHSLSDHYGIPPEDYWRSVEDWSATYFAGEIETAKRLLPFRPGMTALDVGAGLGHAMRSLTHAGFDTWGIEPSQPFFDRAAREVDPARLQMATIEEADFPDRSFDFITFGAVLEHLYSPGAALSKALRWLRPKGIVQAEVPNAHRFDAKVINAFFRLRGTNYVTHLSPMHSPFHLYEFGLKSFRSYEVAEHVKTGHQLTVYLRRPA